MKYRDVTLISLNEQEYLAITCDTSASIGLKKHDFTAVSPFYTGAFCARVSLMELIAMRAVPKTLVHLVGNEFNPTAAESLRGIEEELKKADLQGLEINGSSEENMKTSMTCISTVAIGILPKKDSRLYSLKAGDVLYCLGEPHVGMAVLEYEQTIVTYEEIFLMTRMTGVKDILPVGSAGIYGEAVQMAYMNNLTIYWDDEWYKAPVLHNSAGPATVCLAGVAATEAMAFEKKLPRAKRLGTFID